MILSLETFRNYVEDHAAEIFEQIFMSFNSANFMTHYPGVKGKEIITVGKTDVDNVVQKWKRLHVDEGRQSVDLDTTFVETFHAQIHEKYVPEELEKTYKGALRKKGQDPRDFPFAAYVAAQLVKAVRAFHEKCLFQAVANGASQSGMALFDGLLEQLKTAITATDITPNTYGIPYLQKYKEEAIPAGYTSILTIVEDMANSFTSDMRSEGINLYLNTQLKTMYDQAYRNVHGTQPTTDKAYDISRTMIDGTAGEPVYLIGTRGLGNSQRIFGTPLRNITYNYDAEEDMSFLNSQYILNVLHIFGAFRVGSNLLMKDDEWIVCNELE